MVLTETQRFQRRFWEQFRTYARSSGAPLKLRKP